LKEKISQNLRTAMELKIEQLISKIGTCLIIIEFPTFKGGITYDDFVYEPIYSQ